MNASAALKGYSNVQVNAGVESASSHRLIQMLFDGLLERIAQAKGAIQRNDIETRGTRINSAISIVLGLQDSLDTDSGAEVSYDLDNLYAYIQQTLMRAHQNADESLLDECAKLIINISSAWREIG